MCQTTKLTIRKTRRGGVRYRAYREFTRTRIESLVEERLLNEATTLYQHDVTYLLAPTYNFEHEIDELLCEAGSAYQQEQPMMFGSIECYV